MLSRIDISGLVVLDVGVQDKPSSRLTKGQAREYLTLDIDPQWKPDIVADLNVRSTLTMNVSVKRFDAIFCIEVLEHCWNPIQVLKNMQELLKEDGMLYLSTPFINPHHDVVDYLRYTDEWYEEVLPRLGFTDIEIHERLATTGLDDLKSFYAKEGMKYSKIRAQKEAYRYPVGYFVKARKGKPII